MPKWHCRVSLLGNGSGFLQKDVMNKENVSGSGCGYLVSVVALILLSGIGWHYVNRYKAYQYQALTTSDGLFGEKLGEHCDRHGFVHGMTTVKTWGGASGPMVTRIKPLIPSCYFNEYLAYLLPKSRRTFKLVGMCSFDNPQELTRIFEEVYGHLCEKYGSPVKASESEALFRVRNRVILLSQSVDSAGIRLSLSVYIPRLSEFELPYECAMIAQEERLQLQERKAQEKKKRKIGL